MPIISRSFVSAVNPDSCMLAHSFSSWWHVNRCWSYNHGKCPGINRAPDLSGFDGLNQLYGDGRVLWQPVHAFDLPALYARSDTISLVRGCVGDTTFY